MPTEPTTLEGRSFRIFEGPALAPGGRLALSLDLPPAQVDPDSLEVAEVRLLLSLDDAALGVRETHILKVDGEAAVIPAPGEALLRIHLPEAALLYATYVRISVTFALGQVMVLSKETLPADWNSILESESTQKIGTKWALGNRSFILKVPSSVVPEKHNCLINPSHLEAVRLTIGDSTPFRFDPRLVK